MFLFNNKPDYTQFSGIIFKYIICSYSTKLTDSVVRLIIGFKYIICSYSTLAEERICSFVNLFKYIICSYSTEKEGWTHWFFNLFKYIICSYSTTVFIAFLLSIIPQKLNIFNTFPQNYQSQYTYLYPLPHARLFQHFLLFRPPPPGKVKNISIPKTHYIYRSIPLPFSHSTSASAPLITVILGPRCPKSQSSITGTPKSPSAYNTASS